MGLGVRRLQTVEWNLERNEVAIDLIDDLCDREFANSQFDGRERDGKLSIDLVDRHTSFGEFG